MATVNYPELLPHPLVSDGYGFRSNQSQAVSLFDVETQSRDETRTVNVGFTFTDLQYKVFHGWFMNVLIHGQKWFNMRLDGEFYECTFGGVQPQYSLNRKIITVTATLKTRPNTGFVSYTNQRVSYPDAVNYMPSPFDPEGWTDGANGTVTNVALENPSGEPVLGLAVQDGAGFFTMQDSFSNDLSVIAGEKIYIGIILKPVNSDPFDIAIVIGGSATPIKTLKIAVEDLSVRSSNMTDYQITDLGDGFKLFQAYWTAEIDDPDTYGRYTFTASNAGTSAPIGSQVYAQAAFFGKTGKYQGAISYNAVNYMLSPFDPEGWNGAGDPDGEITNEVIANPSGQAFIGVAEQVGASYFTLINNYSNNLPVLSGETLCASVLLKKISGDIRIDLGIGGDSISRRTGIFDMDSFSPSGVLDSKVTDLGDGFYLFQVKRTFTADNADAFADVVMADESGAPASFGSKVYIQAAFFGKADDWPAIITPADPDQFPAAITYEY